LDAVMAADIDRDLRDASWRDIFHQALRDDRRFLRGLFDLSHGFVVGDATVPGPAAFLRLTAEERRQNPASVEKLRHQSRSRLRAEAAYEFEYAFALVKTSAVLRHTIRLCTTLDIEAVTDSEGHYRLLELTRRRETLPIRHRHLPRTGY
jgi:hypothetical protein